MANVLTNGRQDEEPCVLLPNQGRLFQFAPDMLKGMELADLFQERKLRYRLASPEGTLMFVRSEDIPTLLHAGVGCVGLTGRDYILEAGVDLEVVGDIDTCPGHLALQVDLSSPVDSMQTLPRAARIVSQYPSFTRRALAAAGRDDVRVTAVSGAAEAFVNAGLAEASVDVVSTGETARANQMKVAEHLAFTSAVVARRPGDTKHEAFHSEILRLARTVAGQQTLSVPVAILA